MSYYGLSGLGCTGCPKAALGCAGGGCAGLAGGLGCSGDCSSCPGAALGCAGLGQAGPIQSIFGLLDSIIGTGASFIPETSEMRERREQQVALEAARARAAEAKASATARTVQALVVGGLVLGGLVLASRALSGRKRRRK